jgi:hypothetical protein
MDFFPTTGLYVALSVQKVDSIFVKKPTRRAVICTDFLPHSVSNEEPFERKAPSEAGRVFLSGIGGMTRSIARSLEQA